MDAIEVAIIAPFADTGDIFQPAGMEGAGTARNRNRSTIHDLAVLCRLELLGDGLLDQDGRAPQATESAIESTLTDHPWKQGTQMSCGVPHESTLAFPWYATSPLGCQPQAQHFTVAELRLRPTLTRLVGLDMRFGKDHPR
jgi:hypothetical protein